jgi:hypothetical protein
MYINRPKLFLLIYIKCPKPFLLMYINRPNLFLLHKLSAVYAVTLSRKTPLLGVATARIVFVAPASASLLPMLYEARAKEYLLLLDASFHAPGAPQNRLVMCKGMQHF